MKEEYKYLYRECTNLSKEYFEESSHFVAVKGTYYGIVDKKLMIVGRIANGWSSIKADSEDEFALKAAIQFGNIMRFDSMITNENGKLYLTSDMDKDKKDRYLFNTKPFWSYSKEIYEKLPGTTLNYDLWMNNIVYSNLYKVGSTKPGAVSINNWSLSTQLLACREILKKEIEILKPSHILFLTGYDWIWDFKDIFDTISHIGTNETKKNIYDQYVEAVGYINNIPAVITCRPEYKNKEKFVSDALQMFDYLSRRKNKWNI